MNKAMLLEFLRVLFASIAILCTSLPSAQCGGAAARPWHRHAWRAALRRGFSHFDYADPSAPQGGVFRNAATGTFDTLNPFIVRGRAALGLGYVFESLMQRSWDEPSRSTA